MRVVIIGADGYLGWPLMMRLSGRGHRVMGIDSEARRSWVREFDSSSAIPITGMAERLAAWSKVAPDSMAVFQLMDCRDHDRLCELLALFGPDAIVHLGEMPSAPFSMADYGRCLETHRNNVEGTLSLLWAMRAHCPDAHLIKLGTMGEYGTPSTDIPEGWFDLEYGGRKTRALFPRSPGSFYHATKVHDSTNVEFACRAWGLRSTDIMQGVVYGTRTAEMSGDFKLQTRFDFDAVFGTVINRFVAQALIGRVLTPYGSGEQKRGFLPLRDSMDCLTIAVENPPAAAGEYRVFNQLDTSYSMLELAAEVGRVAHERTGVMPAIEKLQNPRVEASRHHYNPESKHLRDLGYKPTGDLPGQLREMFEDLAPWVGRIETYAGAIDPQVRWRTP